MARCRRLTKLKRRTLRAASRTTTPPGGWQDESQQPGGQAGQDALLFLRTAVRHSAQGPRQPGDRLRAVGGVPVQSRDAVPERRQALPAESAIPTGLLDPLMRDATPAFADASWDEALDFTAPRLREIQERYGKDCRGGLRRRVADHREVLPARQVRARGARHAAHRLQRPPLHGLGRHGLQAGVRRRPLRRFRGATSRRPTCCSSSGPTSPNARRSRRTTSGAAATRGGKLIVTDPRMTPITRNADLYPAGAARHGSRAAAWGCCT